jgi:hypothetical protein
MIIKINLVMKNHRKNKINNIINIIPNLEISNNSKFCIFHGFNNVSLKYKFLLKNDFNSNYICILNGFNSKNFRIVIGSYNFNFMKTIPIKNIKERINFLFKKFNCSRNYIINKTGNIVICPNNSNGWYVNRFNLNDINFIIKTIKLYSNLNIQLRLHPKDRLMYNNNTNFKENIDMLLSSNNITLNNQIHNDLLRDSYCLITDNSSIGFQGFSYGIPIFNLFNNNYSDSFNFDFSTNNKVFLNPNKINSNQLPNRNFVFDKYLPQYFLKEELYNNDYFFKILYKYFSNK